MSNSQIAAALGLLKKTMPDLAAIEHTGEGGGPLQVIVQKIAGLG